MKKKSEGIAFIVAMLIVALAFLPALLAGQKPHGLRARQNALNAAADSANFHFELGFDHNVTQAGDSLANDYRLALLFNPRFSLEARVAAKQETNPTETYVEAQTCLNLTGAIFPGSTNFHGSFLEVAPCYNYEGGPFQYAAQVGMGMRVIGTSTLAIRTEVIYEYRAARASLPSGNSKIIRVGVTFWP